MALPAQRPASALDKSPESLNFLGLPAEGGAPQEPTREDWVAPRGPRRRRGTHLLPARAGRRGQDETHPPLPRPT